MERRLRVGESSVNRVQDEKGSASKVPSSDQLKRISAELQKIEIGCYRFLAFTGFVNLTKNAEEMGILFKRVFFSVLALGLLFEIAVVGVTISKQKLFWLDEGYEITNNCAQTYPDLVVAGARKQCSPQPLYYIFQKTFIDTFVKKFDDEILVRYRLFSIITALLIAILFLIYFGQRFHLGYGILAILMLFQKYWFAEYIAENRPYMFWMFWFAGFILHLSFGRINFLTFFFALGLTLVAGPGFMQVGIGVATAFVLLQFIPKRSSVNFINELKKIPVWLKASLLICIPIGIYFSLKSCSTIAGGPWDLLHTQNWRLVVPVVGLFVGTHSIAAIISNIFCIIGFIFPWLYKRDILQIRSRPESKWAFQISVHCLTQFLIAFVIAGLVIWKGYYFIPRAFSYFYFIRIFWCVVGIYFVYHAVQKTRPAPTTPWLSIVFLIIMAGPAYEIWKLRASTQIQVWIPDPTRALGSEVRLQECKPIRGSVSLIRGSQKRDWEYASNATVKLYRSLKDCAEWKAGDQIWYAFPVEQKEDGNDVFELSQSPPKDALPITQCGRDVILQP